MHCCPGQAPLPWDFLFLICIMGAWGPLPGARPALSGALAYGEGAKAHTPGRWHSRAPPRCRDGGSWCRLLARGLGSLAFVVFSVSLSIRGNPRMQRMSSAAVPRRHRTCSTQPPCLAAPSTDYGLWARLALRPPHGPSAPGAVAVSPEAVGQTRDRGTTQNSGHRRGRSLWDVGSTGSGW